MHQYEAPLNDMRFVIHELVGLAKVEELNGFDEVSEDLVDAVLEEAGKFAADILAPLNRSGDVEGARWDDGEVSTAEGWQSAYSEFCEAGWNGLALNPEFGGQGLPKILATAVSEMWNGANLSFAVCPMLIQGAIEAIESHGSDALKKTYLEKMVSGEWTGTMNLTEPQAGSDLSKVRSKAVPEGDHYLISGQKIYITYGEHDLTDNIIHLVLARTPDAPEGTRGISLFVVPKFLVNDDGSIGERNDVRCVSIEHKLGIHASPTAVMSYGDNGGAIGYLVGEENRGLPYMFTMMNAARHAVGLEGVAIGDAAYRHALRHARERVQGQPIGGEEGASIIEHPDVRRMLMTMRAKVEAMRALAYVCALEYDVAERHSDTEVRERAARRGDLFTPIVKGWSTETGQQVASIGVQIHGGMGFVEETGAAQFYRDSRITTIYEGTTGIQAGDLVGRKTLRDGGQAVAELIEEMRVTLTAMDGASDASVAAIRRALNSAVDDFEATVGWLLESAADPRKPAAGSVYYLEMAGCVCGGWMLAESARIAAEKLAANEGDENFYRAKIAAAVFFAQHVLPVIPSLKAAITDGAESTLALAAEAL
ncbi:MAG: acyl-CoA dehydrogenase [Pseudomonadota bacterium]